MKYLFLLLSLLCASLGLNAQNGYYFGDKFIELKINSGLSPYKMSSTSVSTFSNKAIQSNGYISQIYQTETVDRKIIKNSMVIDASNYDRGYYVIRTEINGKKFDKKIFVNNNF